VLAHGPEQQLMIDAVEGNRRILPKSMMFRSWFGLSADIMPSRIVFSRFSAEDTAMVGHI
jgi:hypothetical protein